MLYALVTIQVTLWRKQFREASNKHDNEYHNKATDALLNYETVKYFTNEQHEIDTYHAVIQKYQTYSVNVQASLSLLNGSQAVIIQLTMLAALAGAMAGECVPIKGRFVGEPMTKRVNELGGVKVNHAHAVKKPSEIVGGVEVFKPDRYTTYA